MKKVYLVRHGQTTHNVHNLTQDHSPSLTESGREQAQVIAQRIASLDFQHLVVSDYERTKQTAEPLVASLGITPVYSELFREVRRPSEFFHSDKSADAYQEYIKNELTQFSVDEHWKHSDEESFADTSARVTKALAYLAGLDGDVVVITHGHFIIKTIATVAVGGELSGSLWQQMRPNFKAFNTGISTLVYDEESEGWKILTFNDIAHFAE